MIAYAAMDVHDGQVVQLVGGETHEAHVVLSDPVAVAISLAARGFPALHVVDLDSALGTGDNRTVITSALRAVSIPVQIGGGVRSEDDVAYWIDEGASQIIIGTRALRDRNWLRNVAARYPGRVLVAADVRAGYVVTHGSREPTSTPVIEYIHELNEMPVGGVLVTDMDREGRLRGADVPMFAKLAGVCEHPLIASGGIASADDLQMLEKAGVSGVILGMALYAATIDDRLIRTDYAR